MKGFKITDINFHQAVTLPAGVYTYSCKATPVGSSITFRVGSTDYVIDSLTPGVYQKGIKKTFTIETDQSYFYPSRTVGDEIFEPQLEEGTVATTAGPHILDASEEVSRAGIEINDEMVRTYATKVDVSSEIIQTAESINTRVSNAEGRIGAVEVAADSINTRVSNAEGWIGAVEVTPASINSSVTKSGQIASQILQEDGTVKISAEQITLEGSETASGKFIVTVDGTIKAKEAEITGTVSSNASGSKITIDADSRSLVMSDTNNSEVVKLAFASTGNYSHANFKLSAFTGTTEYSRMSMDAFGMDYRQMSPGASFNTYATIGNGIVEVGSTTSSSSNYLSIQVDSAGIPYIAMAGGVIRGLGVFVRTVSSGTTLFNEDCAIISTATSSITINLPLNPSVGRLCIIAKRGSSASNITVNGNGRQIYSTSSGPVSSILIGSGIFVYTDSYWQYI